MHLYKHIMEKSGRSYFDLFTGADPLVRMEQTQDGGVFITKWDKSLGKQPTPEEITEIFAKPEPEEKHETTPKTIDKKTKARALDLHAKALRTNPHYKAAWDDLIAQLYSKEA